MAPLPRAQMWILALVALGVPLSAWGAIYPANTWIQLGPVVLLLPAAYLALRRWPLSNTSAACMATFVILHMFAARWSYSFVPFDDWMGGAISAMFDWERNHFDRLVHFAFGVLAMPPMMEMGVRYWGMTKRLSWVYAVTFVLAFGGLYEIFEWSLTLTLAPEAAGAYNGEQGDMFDAQEDMALAGLAALLMIPLVRKASWWKE